MTETKSIFHDMVFCPHCNHAVSIIQWNLIKADVCCPNCRLYPFSRFYSYGSSYHKEQVRHHTAGVKLGVTPFRGYKAPPL